ncbi:DUF3727 domain-containing protein [Oculatella sp. LEGE 06141]|nr:DUF3727 domain-containing protein [Oculatella sp. LEGE 06141]
MDDDDLEQQAPTVELTDEDGRSLLCYVEKSLDVDNQEYVLLQPVEVPVVIFAWEPDEEDEEEGTLEDIDDDEVDEIFTTARAILAEQDLILNRTAITLTATGDLPDTEEDDLITLEVGEDEADMSVEEFQQLANFFYEEQEYVICTPLDPLLFFARLNHDGEPKLLTPEEFQAVQPQLEDQLFDELE